MKKILILVVAILISSCSIDTPNNVNMSISQGTCALSSYVSGNPTTAPYCMAVTLQNNNSGYNATNVQITTTGMVLSYTANGTSYSGIMCDPTAATSTNCSTGGGVQAIGDITMYDPNNCATTQGINVTTLSQSGGSCTFYLQLSGESYPVGVYPTSLTYNYTNGNTNYSITSSFNQRVNLYAGGSFGTVTPPTGLAFYNGSGAFQTMSPNYTGNTVTSFTSDNYGNIYAGTNSGLVSQYNGTTWNSLPSANTVIGTGVTNINALMSDESSNIYAATNNGVYMLTFESTTWNILNQANLSTNVVGLQIDTSDNIYATTESGLIYKCSVTNSCSWSQLYSGLPVVVTSVANGAFALIPPQLATPFIGTNNGLYSYNTSWLQYTGYTGSVTGIAESTTDSNIYVTANDNAGTESSIYTGTTSGGVLAIESSSAGNTVNGDAFGLVLDSGNNLFIGGSTLTSTDFGSTTGALAAYLALSSSTSIWVPITGLTGGQINALTTSSQLTSY